MSEFARPVDFTSVAEQRQAVMGKLLGLVGVAFVCTALGALIGVRLGPAAFLLSSVGSIGTLIALFIAKEKAPVNLWLMYAFATFEGMALGLILESYIARGLGAAVLNAAATTATVTVVAGAYGATTKRDLSGLGSALFLGLIAVVIASVIGLFIHLPMLYLGIA